MRRPAADQPTTEIDVPLLMCPNCNAAMQPVSRSGVEFDMCPSCRGVWLDRGELEKILAETRAEVAAAGRPAPEQGYGSRYRDDDDDDRKYREGYGRRKSRSIFDIFD